MSLVERARVAFEKVLQSPMFDFLTSLSIKGLSACTIVLVYLYLLRRQRRARALSFPRPPHEQLFWGHLFTMPAEYHWRTFGEWSKALGSSHSKSNRISD